jgi:hypothetical protein
MRGKNAKTLKVEQLIGQSPDKVAKMIRERDAKRLREQREAEYAADIAEAEAAEAAEQKEP